MFKKKDIENPERFDTLIGPNTVIEGNIESEGIIRIDGKLKGDLNATGDVFVGSNALVTGNIHANNVFIYGTAEGNINADSLLKLYSTARLHGDICIRGFTAEEGSVFQGKCRMIDQSLQNESLEQTAAASEKSSHKRNHSAKDYKKSPVLEQPGDDNKDSE